ncbi:NADH-quinone oxidoreductase subunit E [Fuscibacter oryzae]|uniref:NADH-quinone oxidoreductase subunit E n=1 Tax=Fuscibacter oryzae TaxID=2803939 RepID=A0A8J7SR20_9RHOB|nr:NADH-quinone oxidoreductase subunit E [Fuscibacter oryzae]MBL4927246.1 NADH-quinone oxidoreductase subunit E [Fuscibacter oryzae]
MLRRLHKDQPASFEFTPANLAWAKGQISKYPEGRQASAVIPLLWRAQEQHGWLTRPAIEYVADMLGMAYIRALEVATFYFMFQLQPVGSVAHIQICGTTSCMICGAEELIAVCQELVAKAPHQLSVDGKFSWEEVECLGACTNAPMAQIGKDYYEDLTADKLRALIGRFSNGEVPVAGPQNGRYAAEPLSGLTTLQEFESGKKQYNASAQLAVDIGDSVKRIDGTEVPLTTPWLGVTVKEPAKAAKKTAAPKLAALADVPAAEPAAAAKAPAKAKPAPKAATPATPAEPASGLAAALDHAAKAGTKPVALAAARDGKGDDLKKIEGIGPALEKLCHELGIFHFDQIAQWGDAEVTWMDGNLKGFKGRVTRDKWVAQAKLILEVGVEEFLRRAKSNDY